LLGKMHRVVKNYDAGKSRKNMDFGIARTRRYFSREKKNILQSKFGRSPEFVRVWREEMDKIRLLINFPQGMIHEDLGRRHVFWHNNKIEAIIDFDRCYYGYLVLDLGQALRGWCFTGNWSRWSEGNCKKFIAGYESERKLPVRERNYLLSAVKFAILERALAYCTRYVYGVRPEKCDEKFAHDSLFGQIKLVKM
jgi:Ser/Thr protein kinase RdoA (MazF antagonist)